MSASGPPGQPPPTGPANRPPPGRVLHSFAGAVRGTPILCVLRLGWYDPQTRSGFGYEKVYHKHWPEHAAVFQAYAAAQAHTTPTPSAAGPVLAADWQAGLARGYVVVRVGQGGRTSDRVYSLSPWGVQDVAERLTEEGVNGGRPFLSLVSRYTVAWDEKSLGPTTRAATVVGRGHQADQAARLARGQLELVRELFAPPQPGGDTVSWVPDRGHERPSRKSPSGRDYYVLHVENPAAFGFVPRGEGYERRVMGSPGRRPQFGLYLRRNHR